MGRMNGEDEWVGGTGRRNREQESVEGRTRGGIGKSIWGATLLVYD